MKYPQISPNRYPQGYKKKGIPRTPGPQQWFGGWYIEAIYILFGELALCFHTTWSIHISGCKRYFTLFPFISPFLYVLGGSWACKRCWTCTVPQGARARRRPAAARAPSGGGSSGASTSPWKLCGSWRRGGGVNQFEARSTIGLDITDTFRPKFEVHQNLGQPPEISTLAGIKATLQSRASPCATSPVRRFPRRFCASSTIKPSEPSARRGCPRRR